MATQVPVNLLNAGGTLVATKVKAELCKSFVEAVDEWCDPSKKRKGKFNDVFFKKLRKNNKALAGAIAREAPIVTGAVQGTASALSGVAGPARRAANMANRAARAAARGLSGGATSVITGAFTGIVPSCLGWGGKAIGLAKSVGCNIRYPDGLIGNQVVEIKGPGDYFKDPQQKKDYQAFSSPRAPIVPDCKSCGAKCENGPLGFGDDGCR